MPPKTNLTSQQKVFKHKQTRIAVAAVLFVFSWSLISKAEVPSIPNENTWVTNGPVRDSVVLNNTLYIGGDFSQVGPYVGSAIPIDAKTGYLAPSFPKINGIVWTIISDLKGGWFIGGEFSRAGSLKRSNLAHVLSDGTVDPVWTPDPNGIVEALLLSGTTLYAGGRFDEISGMPHLGMAAVDAKTGVAASWAPAFGGGILVFSIEGSTLYVGGTFGSVNGETRKSLAAFDLTTYTLTSWNPNELGTPFILYSMVISSPTMYIGGSFSSFNGETRSDLAAVDINSGTLSSSWAPITDGGGVKTMAIKGSNIYVGGFFSKIGNPLLQTRNHLAALDLTTGDLMPWNPMADGLVFDLVLDSSTLYVCGFFSNIGFESRNGLAAIDIESGFPTSWNPDAGFFNAQALTLEFQDSIVYAGGVIGTFGAETRNHIAALDAATGRVTSWNPNANGSVLSLAASSTTIYAGGGFNTIDGEFRGHLAALDPLTGRVRTWSPRADDPVLSIAMNQSTLYIGGEFEFIGTEPRNHLAAFDLLTGRLKPWNPDADSRIFSFAVVGSTVFVGGDFMNINGLPREHLAALDAVTGAPTTWTLHADSRVSSLVVHGSTIFLGGEFTKLFDGMTVDVTRNHVAALDGVSGRLTSWAPDVDDGVNSLAVDGANVYIGGRFRNVDGQPRMSLASVSRIDNGTLSDWNPSVGNVNIYSLKLVGSVLMAGLDYSFDSRPGFIQFGAFESSPALQSGFSSVDSINAYPNPFIPGQGTNDMTFENLPEGANVKIYTLTGALVAELTADPDGKAIWTDVENQSGEKVASGVYFVLAKGNGTKTIKVAVER